MKGSTSAHRNIVAHRRRAWRYDRANARPRVRGTRYPCRRRRMRSNSAPPTPTPPGSGGGESITGRERIGWDQQAVGHGRARDVPIRHLRRRHAQRGRGSLVRRNRRRRRLPVQRQAPFALRRRSHARARAIRRRRRACSRARGRRRFASPSSHPPRRRPRSIGRAGTSRRPPTASSCGPRKLMSGLRGADRRGVRAGRPPVHRGAHRPGPHRVTTRPRSAGGRRVDAGCGRRRRPRPRAVDRHRSGFRADAFRVPHPDGPLVVRRGVQAGAIPRAARHARRARDPARDRRHRRRAGRRRVEIRPGRQALSRAGRSRRRRQASSTQRGRHHAARPGGHDPGGCGTASALPRGMGWDPRSGLLWIADDDGGNAGHLSAVATSSPPVRAVGAWTPGARRGRRIARVLQQRRCCPHCATTRWSRRRRGATCCGCVSRTGIRRASRARNRCCRTGSARYGSSRLVPTAPSISARTTRSDASSPNR